MGNKYFTVSFDDGLAQDREIIRLMEKYGIRGTFNISSGLFGERTYIQRIGDLGFKTVPEMGKNPKQFAEHFILPKDEAVELYSHPNVEVASHGVHHLHQNKFTMEEARDELLADIEALSELFGYRVIGHAFPYGSYNDNVLTVLKDAGVRYARSAMMMKKPKDFSFDPNRLIINPTCWALDSFAEEMLQKFIAAPDTGEMQVFYMWAHGYEFDYGSKRGNFAHLEKLFAMASGASGINFVTNGELYTV